MTAVAVAGILIVAFVVLSLLIDKGVDVAALGAERVRTLGAPRAYVVVDRPAEEVCAELRRVGQLTQDGQLHTEIGVQVQMRAGTGAQADRLECRWDGRPDTTLLLQAVKGSVEATGSTARVIVK